MAKVVKGVVTWAGDEKKYGNYSFKLKDHDAWFRSPNRCADIIKPGYTVQVKVEENERGDFDVKAKPKLVAKGKPPAKGGGRGGRGGGGYKKDPEVEKRIVMQHSQEMAVSTAALLIANEAIKLGAKTKPDARRTQILELIDELTAKFHAEAFDADSVLEKAKEIDDDLDADEEESEEDEAEESGDDDEPFDDEVPWDDD